VSCQEGGKGAGLVPPLPWPGLMERDITSDNLLRRMVGAGTLPDVGADHGRYSTYDYGLPRRRVIRAILLSLDLLPSAFPTGTG
jgi:hypothetical protein